MAPSIEDIKLAAANPELELGGVIAAASDAYATKALPPNTEAPCDGSVNAHIPNLKLVDGGKELSPTKPLNKLTEDAEGTSALQTDQIGIGGALGRARETNAQPELSARKMDIIRDAQSLSDGQFNQSGPGQHFVRDLQRVELKGGQEELERQVNRLNLVLEAARTPYELQIRTSPGKDGQPIRNLSIIVARTGDVSDVKTGYVADSIPFPLLQNMVQPLQPTERVK